MNNSRNFATEISNKNSFISLKNEINSKIKESLFDDNSLFLSSSFNYLCSNYKTEELPEEGSNICNLLDNLSYLDEDEALRANSNTETDKKEKSKNIKKLSESEDDKSSSFGSKQTKTTQNEENKCKFNIGLINYTDLVNLLNINEKDAINNQELNISEKEKIDKKIKAIEEEMKENENEIEVRNEYLRKNVCLKLYKAFHFAFKKFSLQEKEIKSICLYLEKQGRLIDNSMNEKYKEFIENIFKKISNEKIKTNEN